MDGTADRPDRHVTVRPASRDDWWWLTKEGLAPAMVGVQYHPAEAPLQLLIAPTRGTGLRSGSRCIIEVDGVRAGYIGRNPLSGNLEYFLRPWARGGTGTTASAIFLRDHRSGDRRRAFFVSSKNERSRRALERAFDRLGWHEGDQYAIAPARMGWRITVAPA